MRDVGAREDRVVVQHVPAFGRAVEHLAAGRYGRGRLHENRARVDTHGLHDRPRRRFVVGVQVGFGFLRSAQHPSVLGVQEVPGAVDTAFDLRGRAARLQRGQVAGGRRQDRRPFGGPQHSLVLGQSGSRSARAFARAVPGDRSVARGGRSAGPDHVGLPVIEVQLRRPADLLFGARRIAHVRQRDQDFGGARALDFGLRDAELVNPFAHDVDRAFERFGVHLGPRGGLGLIDELHAALQVEPQAGLFRLHRARDADDREQQRDDDQPRDDQQDQGVAAAV